MTAKELQTRQAWTLEQKIDHSVGAIESFIARTGKTPYISFSGGKDSTVLLDICRRFVSPNMKAVFCNTGNEYPEIVKFVRMAENVTVIRPKMRMKEVIEKYGFPLISKEQALFIRQAKTTKSEYLLSVRMNGKTYDNGAKAGGISNRWKFLVNEPYMVSEKCCDCLKKRPFAIYNKETDEVPIMGIMAGESKARKHQYIHRGGCNSFVDNKIGCYPISIWTDKDIWAYIRKYNVPYCELYDKGHTRTGCMFCGFGAHLEKTSRFDLLYDSHPKAYNLFMNYTNNGVTYREALRKVGISLPDVNRQLKLW